MKLKSKVNNLNYTNNPGKKLALNYARYKNILDNRSIKYVQGGFKIVTLLNIERLNSTYKDHKRLRVFANKGCKCVNCSIEGVYLAMCINEVEQIHINLYTKDYQLMTIDHIIPKSKGGNNALSNLQPMCSNCNEHKADKYEDINKS